MDTKIVALLLSFCSIALAQLQPEPLGPGNCDADIQQYADCRSRAMDGRPDHDAIRSQIDNQCLVPNGCQTPNMGGPGGSGFGPGPEVFQCLMDLKTSVRSQCREEGGIGFDLPERHHHGHGHHHGRHRRGFGWGMRRGGRGGGGQRSRQGGNRDDHMARREQFMRRMAEQLCPEQAAAESALSCAQGIMESQRQDHDQVHQQMDQCRESFDQSGCQGELDAAEETVCSCLQEKAMSDPNTVQRMQDCAQGAGGWLGQMMETPEARGMLAQRSCGGGRGRRGRDGHSD